MESIPNFMEKIPEKDGNMRNLRYKIYFKMES